jgi:hypothetical protein
MSKLTSKTQAKRYTFSNSLELIPEYLNKIFKQQNSSIAYIQMLIVTIKLKALNISVFTHFIYVLFLKI